MTHKVLNKLLWKEKHGTPFATTFSSQVFARIKFDVGHHALRADWIVCETIVIRPTR